MDTSVRTQDSSPLGISTIGEEPTIAGDVTSKGELHIDGHVQGDVYCVALVLGENAQLEGNSGGGRHSAQSKSEVAMGTSWSVLVTSD